MWILGAGGVCGTKKERPLPEDRGLLANYGLERNSDLALQLASLTAFASEIVIRRFVVATRHNTSNQVGEAAKAA